MAERTALVAEPPAVKVMVPLFAVAAGDDCFAGDCLFGGDGCSVNAATMRSGFFDFDGVDDGVKTLSKDDLLLVLLTSDSEVRMLLVVVIVVLLTIAAVAGDDFFDSLASKTTTAADEPIFASELLLLIREKIFADAVVFATEIVADVEVVAAAGAVPAMMLLLISLISAAG